MRDRIRNILWEALWYEFSDTITLYHGTSSAFLEDIEENGIEPPDEFLELKIETMMDWYMSDIPDDVYDKVRPKLLQKIMSSVNTLRVDTNEHQVMHVVYCTTNKEDAERYARSNYGTGGEIFTDVFRYCNQARKKMGYPETNPKHFNSQPIVLILEIPSDWVKTYEPMRDRYDRIKQWHYDEDDENLFRDVGGFEVRVAQVIPPEMITDIERVQK